MCLYYTWWFWVASPWSRVCPWSCALLEGLHLGAWWEFVVCGQLKGWAKQKAEMGDSIKPPVRNYVGWREGQSVLQLPELWSLSCVPAWDGIQCWWSKDSLGNGGARDLMFWPGEWHVGQKSLACIYSIWQGNLTEEVQWWVWPRMSSDHVRAVCWCLMGMCNLGQEKEQSLFVLRPLCAWGRHKGARWQKCSKNERWNVQKWWNFRLYVYLQGSFCSYPLIVGMSNQDGAQSHTWRQAGNHLSTNKQSTFHDVCDSWRQTPSTLEMTKEMMIR